MKLYQNRSINNDFFSKNSNCDLDIDPTNLKRKIIQAIVISNITVLLCENRLINVVARAMTKGKHLFRLREHNSAIMTGVEILSPLCTYQMHV